MEKETDIPATPRMVIDLIHGELKLVSVEPKETDKYTDDQIDAAVSKTAEDFFKRPIVDPPSIPNGYVSYMEYCIADEKTRESDPEIMCGVPYRTYHGVYRKGDGLWKWLKCKWWEWKDKR